MSERLQKFLSASGVCSRRQAEELIKKGLVSINGQTATLGTKINPEYDEIKISGKMIKKPVANKKTYVILNKPVGYISSTSNCQGKSALELLTPKNYFGKNPPPLPRLVIVGRLDKDSRGLLLLTNDNELVNQLTHPRYKHEKEYEIILAEPFKKTDQKIMERGMRVNGETYQGVKFSQINNNLVRIILREGKNRQIRKMFGALGYNLRELKRVRVNNFHLKNLPEGKWTTIS